MICSAPSIVKNKIEKFSNALCPSRLVVTIDLVSCPSRPRPQWELKSMANKSLHTVVMPITDGHGIREFVGVEVELKMFDVLN